MASWATLSQTLVQLDSDIRSVKSTVRTKALEKLQSLLDNRPEELIQLLRGQVFSTEVSWPDLIDSAHEGCIQQVTRLGEIQGQKGLGAVEQKNGIHYNVLQKLITLANRDNLTVSYSSILSKAFHCFANRWMVQYFGVCYLQIVYRFVLLSQDNLQDVSIHDWSRLLSYCFQLYDSDHIKKLILLQCFSPIIEGGCKYTFFSTDLVQYLPKLEEITASNLEFNSLTELIKTISGFCTNLALDCRLTVCQFLENTLGVIIKSYNNRLNDDSKILFYELITLAVVVHAPEVTFSATNRGFAVNRDVWHKHLRNMFHLVQADIKQMNSQTNRFQNNPSICPHFVEMAATLCTALFWNDEVWNDQECNSEPSSKKIRRSVKIEGIMELVEFQKGKFCWRWMSIFAQLLKTYPACLEVRDFQPILQMLHDFQLTIQYPVQVITLHTIIRVLRKEINANTKSATVMNEEFTNDIWVKIAQTAFRTTSSNLLSENLRLLRTVIVHKKLLPLNFIETILKAFLSNSIRKSNEVVQLLVEIYRHYNVDVLGEDYRCQTMKWLHKTDLVMNFEAIRVELVAELSVLCIFSKIDVDALEHGFGSPVTEKNVDISNLRTNLLYKSLNRLIVSDQKDCTTNTLDSSKLPQANALKCVVSEIQFQNLFEILNPDKDVGGSPNSLDAFNRVTSALSMYLHLLGQFIAYESMDKVGLEKTFLAKKAHFKVEQLEMCIADFSTFNKFTEKDAMDVMEALTTVFVSNLNPVQMDIILSHPMPATIRWLREYSGKEPGRDSKLIAQRVVDELNLPNRLRYDAFMALAFLSQGPNESEAFNVIDEFDFNLNSNTDLLIVRRVIESLFKHTPSPRKAEWCFNHIKSMCQLYYRNQHICQLVIDTIPDLSKYICGFPDMTDDLVILMASFLTQTKKKKYGPALTKSLILKMRHVMMSHANHIDVAHFRDLFFVLARFLPPNMLAIQYATIETLALVFDTELIRSSCTQDMNVAQFQRAMFEQLNLEALSHPQDAAMDNQVADIDENSRFVSVNIQIFSTIICKSYILRKETMFLLAEFAFKQELSKDFLLRVMLMICDFLNVDHTTFINENIEYLLSMWLIKNYQLAKFPWFIAPSSTQNDFFNDHIETLSICILRHRSNILEDFVPLIPGETITTIIEPILPNCLAYLTPLFAECSQLSEAFLANGRNMNELLQKNVPDMKKIEKAKNVEIIEFVLLNSWDMEQFRKLFHFDIDFQPEEHMIDVKQLNQCFDYMKLKIHSTVHKTSNFITELCNQKHLKCLKIIHTLKCRIHQTSIIELKLVSMFQYCLFLDYVTEFLVQVIVGPKTKKELSTHIKSYVIRDTTFFLCNVLLCAQQSDGKIVRATVEYLNAFCRRLLPRSAMHFESCVQLIVSTLVSIVEKSTVNTWAKIQATSLKCLRFLIVELGGVLDKDISLLDNFPTNAIFDELRAKHQVIKYRGRQFSLANELDCFLQAKSRKAEGLMALREKLSSKKNELDVVFQDHQAHVKQSNSYENTRLHSLVLSLIESAQGSDAIASLEAVKCLGELGPSDLSMIVLQPDSKLHTYKHFSTLESATNHLCRITLKALQEMLVHPDPDVGKVVFQAIVHLLKFKDVQTIGDEYPSLSLFYDTTPKAMPVYNEPKSDNLKLVEILSNNEFETHSVWIRALVSEMLRLFGDSHLNKVANVHLSFAECLLPLLTHMMLTCGKREHLVIELRNSVAAFFQKHSDFVQSPELSSAHPGCIYLNRASIKSMLNVTECIRMFNLFNFRKTIELDYLHVARAAQYCDAHFTSILYADLWAIKQTDDAAKSNSSLQHIMKESYMSIGENAAVTPFLDPIANRTVYLQFNQSWNRIIREIDAQSNSEEMITNLAASGLYGLSKTISQHPSSDQYECAWRLSDWSLLDTPPSPTTTNACNFESNHYAALRCLQLKDEMGAETAIGLARKHVIVDLKSSSLECTHNVYKHLQRLALVQQVDDFMSVQFNRSETVDQNVFDKWRFQDQIACSNFKYKEPLLAQRITIFKSAGLRATRKLQNTFNVRSDILQTMILNVATECRLEGQKDLAIRYLAVLYALTTSNEIKAKLWLEDAQLSWRLNDHVMARKLLNKVLALNDVVTSLSRATALRIYGDFQAESHGENVRSLIDKYFKNALKLLDNIQKNQSALCDRMKISAESMSESILDNRIKAYESIAKYSDREYNRVKTYMRSDLFERKKRSVSKGVQTVSEMGGATNQTKELKCTRVVLNKNTEIDKNEIEATQAEHDQFLLLAVFNYVKASVLSGTTKYSVIFRIISLWFSNKDNDEVVQHLKGALPQIPSYNLMAVLPQVAARLTNSETAFGKTVYDIMERCAIEHPQQSMYQILALSNAYDDDTSMLSNIPEPRVLGARKLVAKLQKNESTTLLLSQMMEMCKALIAFANKDTDRISSKEPIRKLSNLSYVHCPTLSLPICKNSNYKNLIITVHKWSDTMSLVGGINAPKKVACLCSDGRQYPQLLKAKDDLRQDAIMQQVFNILNEMLDTHRSTSQSRLSIKTYKVVPLTQRSGILEWCSNTIPLSVYLAGAPNKPGAHERYHPDDLKPGQCRKIIQNYHKDKMVVSQKLEVFQQMCAKFQPALHYFFLEKFHRPGEWFERRLAYTKSVATTSMIGYVLGIGDRHVSNILIDEKTAELIHIDFGIAFEQSKCLPTPETIPFRLTRDIVSAFGVSGVDGIFRKACESTMEVLRLNKTTIVTILEVLLYDPLYAWALSAKSVYSRQDIDRDDDDIGDEKNIMAERALTRIEAKLNGEEEGTSGNTSTVESQVDLLITEAMSPYNLCRLFEGWQAYL